MGKAMNDYCKIIKKSLFAVQSEMSGARNFVHPDREMVELLQQSILDSNQLIASYADDEEKKTSESNATVDEEKTNANKGVHFNTNNGHKNVNPRRTKSVHELAWSKFNAANETEMAQLQQKEAEVLESELRKKILEEIRGQYDDKYDNEVATIRAQLQQDIREQIRLEYEDLIASYQHQRQQH